MVGHTIAVVGTGPDPETPDWGNSAAMAYHHGRGFRSLSHCEIVACVDIVRENAEAFAAEFDVDESGIYEDHAEMIWDVQPDIVSISTPVPTHAEIVVDCAQFDSVRAIHCEKPMATTWSESRSMAKACERNDVQLTFNHQRRFIPQWQRAKRLLDDGEIGELTRLEVGGPNLFDYGTHLFDLCNLFNDEGSPAWTLGSLEYSEENVRYGAHNENQAVVQWQYENGVHGFAATGSSLVDCEICLIGTAGTIEVNPGDGSDLRIRRDGSGWETFHCESVDAITRTIEHVVTCLDEGSEPVVSADNALRAMELIFGSYESVRRRGRVAFPLAIDDNPLEGMVSSGVLLADGVE